MKKIICLCLIFALLTGSLPAMAAVVDPYAKAASNFFMQIDLSYPGLEGVTKKLIDKDYYGALEEYKNIFVERVSKMHLGTLPTQNHYPPDLLMGDEVRFMHGTDIRNLGKVGALDWYGIKTENSKEGYGFHQFMMWHPQTLLETFKANPQENVNYLKRWADIWDDYALNNYAQYNIARNDAKIRAYFTENKLEWFDMQYKQPLIIAWQKNNCIAQLIYGIQADPQMWKKTVSGIQLANILSNLGNVLIELQPYSGIPNQITAAVEGSIKSILLVPEFYKAKKWEADLTRAMSNLSTFGFMLDGTNSEASLNYNAGTINSCLDICKFYTENNIPIPDGIKRLYDVLDASVKFIANMATPSGTEFGLCKSSPKADLTKPFANLPNPLYDSLILPYGGEHFLRSGWGKDSTNMYFYSGRHGNGHEAEEKNAVELYAFGRHILQEHGPGEGLFEGSSWAHNNVVAVDGMGQVSTLAPREPAQEKPIDARFSTSDKFDFTEGLYSYGYGKDYADGVGYTRGKIGAGQVVLNGSAVSHNRKVLFSKESGLYIVLDKMIASGAHTYTNAWNFNMAFPDESVTIEKSQNLIKSSYEGGANVELYSVHQNPLEFNKYYAYEKEPGLGVEGFKLGFYTAAGGYASESPTATVASVYKPAVAMHVNWKGAGDSLLVTAINPIPDTKSDVTSFSKILNGDISGFKMKKVNGNDITMLSTTGKQMDMSAYGIEATASTLLAVQNGTSVSGIVLGSKEFKFNDKKIVLTDFEFEFENGVLVRLNDIKKPITLKWESMGDGDKNVFPVTNAQIFGDPVVGETLRAFYPTTDKYIVEFSQSATIDGAYEKISDTTNNTYTVKTTDVGKFIKAVIKLKTGDVESNPTSVIRASKTDADYTSERIADNLAFSEALNNLKNATKKAICLQIGNSSAIKDGVATKIDPDNADVRPFSANDRTMVPLRFISEAMGLSVSWDAQTGSTIKDGDKTVIVKEGVAKIWINGAEKTIDCAPQTINGRLFVPIRAISEAFGFDVYWDNGFIIISPFEKFVGSSIFSLIEAKPIMQSYKSSITRLYQKPKLNSISINGVPIANFDPNLTYYDVLYTEDSMPNISFTVNGAEALISSSDTSLGERKITLTDSCNSSIKNQYILNFVKNLEGKTESRRAILSVDANGYDGENYPENAIDDNTATRFQVMGLAKYLAADLGSAMPVNRADMLFYAGQRITKFKIFTSTDNETWTMVFDGVSKGTANVVESYNFTQKIARYVKIEMNGNNENMYNGIFELNIYGK